MYNQNFYNNFRGNNFTFHNVQQNFVPATPPPPAFFITPAPFLKPGITDQDFVKTFESNLAFKPNTTNKSVSINEVKEKMRNLVVTLNDIKSKQKYLAENKSTISQVEWDSALNEIENNKAKMAESMFQINDKYLDTLRKLLAKRSAKRLRLKRVNLERKREKQEWVKEMKEKSRQIDENLQKIKDGILKGKQEEGAKLQADIVLKEVMRKKHDAKKCIIKLEALVKLRRARQNTASGRGESVSERDATTFNSNIDKLKSLWTQKLAAYEIEEMGLRATLNQNVMQQDSISGGKERQVVEDLARWREFLFGESGAAPQVDFQGDIGRFVAIRSQWDQFVDNDGSPMPVGWVLPQLKNI